MISNDAYNNNHKTDNTNKTMVPISTTPITSIMQKQQQYHINNNNINKLNSANTNTNNADNAKISTCAITITPIILTL
jgi:hypothetical protein